MAQAGHERGRCPPRPPAALLRGRGGQGRPCRSVGRGAHRPARRPARKSPGPQRAVRRQGPGAGGLSRGGPGEAGRTAPGHDGGHGPRGSPGHRCRPGCPAQTSPDPGSGPARAGSSPGPPAPTGLGPWPRPGRAAASGSELVAPKKSTRSGTVERGLQLIAGPGVQLSPRALRL